MKYSELSEREKGIWDRVYAIKYAECNDAYYAAWDADKAVIDLRIEEKKRR